MAKRILLCDDEIHIVKAAEFKLKRAGYDVETASNGEEAWEIIQRNPPDMLITDCQMPRLDGFGLIQISLWIRWIAKRGITAWTVSQKTRRIVFVGFLIATAIVLGVLVLRVAQRWGFLG